MLPGPRTSQPLLLLLHLKTLATKRIHTTVTARIMKKVQVIQLRLRLERSNISFVDAGLEILRLRSDINAI